ncbi:MAG: apolipoprotein N-acyltransferase [Thermodesulfobacteriota bacterium]
MTLLLPVLSGALAGFSYIPFPPWALFFCLVPLWLFWLRETSWKRVLFGGWLAQFVLTLIVSHWVAHTAHEFGRLSRPVSILVLLLFAALGHMFLPAAGLAFALLRSRRKFSPGAERFLLASLTALAWSIWPMLFPWNLGYAWFGAGMPAFQLAEFVGFEGLGAATIGLNLAFLASWENRGSRKGAAALGAALAFLAVLNASGWFRGKTLPPPDAKVRILVVQGNIGDYLRLREERGDRFREEILASYFSATSRGLAASAGSPPDFAVWPESAFPDIIHPAGMEEGNVLLLREYLSRHAIALVAGARGYDASSGKRTNALFLFDGNGRQAAAPYHKTKLLAFGEYVPGSAAFPALKGLFPRTADFARGNGPETRTLNGLILGPQICYEGLFPGFSRSLAEQGAQLFLNVTNDSWFGDWAEPRQHLMMTLARGIEFRLPVVRATSTGFSAAILADGTLLERSPLRKEWASVYEIPYRKEPRATFYRDYGYRLVPAVLWIAAGGAFLAGRKKKSGRAPKGPPGGATR